MEPDTLLRILFTIGILFLSCEANNPNIVYIIADDLGWNDVSFHGSDQILTPNIDSLAYSGVSLGRYYSHAICTPSRSALLTGKYSHITGMQGYPLVMSEDRGIPTSVSLLPEYLKDAGYSTHLVGKWHVGSSRKEYLPTSRGFDSHFGHRGGYLDYYEYTYQETWTLGRISGMTLFRNQTPAWDVEGYITDVYTEQATTIIKNHDTSSPLFLMVAHNAPHSGNEGSMLQAPPEVVRQMRHVESPERRTFAAMMKKLDDGVGEIIEALHKKGILNKTIIVFVSDNGGMTSGPFKNYGSNYPLRGIKMSPFEGGVRVPGLVWAANMNNTSHYWDGYMHITDWLPTLLSAANVDVPSDLDGINHWNSINGNSASERTVMYEIDDYQGYASIIYEDHKLVTGKVVQSFATYQGANLTGTIGNGPSYVNAILQSTVYNILDLLGLSFDTEDLSVRNKATIKCNQTSRTLCYPDHDTVCLYNIRKDPCETTELSAIHPNLVSTMQTLLKTEMARRLPRVVPMYRNPLSAPSRFNYTWDVWIGSSNDEIDDTQRKLIGNLTRVGFIFS